MADEARAPSSADEIARALSALTTISAAASKTSEAATTTSRRTATAKAFEKLNELRDAKAALVPPGHKSFEDRLTDFARSSRARSALSLLAGAFGDTVKEASWNFCDVANNGAICILPAFPGPGDAPPAPTLGITLLDDVKTTKAACDRLVALFRQLTAADIITNLQDTAGFHAYASFFQTLCAFTFIKGPPAPATLGLDPANPLAAARAYDAGFAHNASLVDLAKLLSALTAAPGVDAVNAHCSAGTTAALLADALPRGAVPHIRMTIGALLSRAILGRFVAALQEAQTVVTAYAPSNPLLAADIEASAVSTIAYEVIALFGTGSAATTLRARPRASSKRGPTSRTSPTAECASRTRPR